MVNVAQHLGVEVDTTCVGACAANRSPMDVVGQTAEDGSGRNGTYTKHLLKHIATPGLNLNALFVRVAKGVEEETEDRQNPWKLDALRVENPCLL